MSSVIFYFDPDCVYIPCVDWLVVGTDEFLVHEVAHLPYDRDCAQERYLRVAHQFVADHIRIDIEGGSLELHLRLCTERSNWILEKSDIYVLEFEIESKNAKQFL